MGVHQMQDIEDGILFFFLFCVCVYMQKLSRPLSLSFWLLQNLYYFQIIRSKYGVRAGTENIVKL